MYKYIRDAWKNPDESLQLLVIHQVRFARTDIRVVNGLMYRQRIGFVSCSVFEIFASLGDLADVDLRIANNWKHEFENLPKYNSDGSEISREIGRASCRERV